MTLICQVLPHLQAPVKALIGRTAQGRSSLQVRGINRQTRTNARHGTNVVSSLNHLYITHATRIIRIATSQEATKISTTGALVMRAAGKDTQDGQLGVAEASTNTKGANNDQTLSITRVANNAVRTLRRTTILSVYTTSTHASTRARSKRLTLTSTPINLTRDVDLRITRRNGKRAGILTRAQPRLGTKPTKRSLINVHSNTHLKVSSTYNASASARSLGVKVHLGDNLSKHLSALRSNLTTLLNLNEGLNLGCKVKCTTIDQVLRGNDHGFNTTSVSKTGMLILRITLLEEWGRLRRVHHRTDHRDTMGIFRIPRIKIGIIKH